MTNQEILEAFLHKIDEHSHRVEDLPALDEWIRKARKYVGLDVQSIREGLSREGILSLILYDINRYINESDWSGAEAQFQLFDEMTRGRKVSADFLFMRWYRSAEVYRRKGQLDKALDSTHQAERYAEGHEMRFRLYFLRGEIESADRNRYEFSVNSLSLALYEAEQLGERYEAKVYTKLAHMFSMRYASLGMYFLRKAQVLGCRLGDQDILLDNKFTMAESYTVMAQIHPKDEQLFLEEAGRVLSTIDYESLPLPQNKMYYREIQGKINRDVDILAEVCAYYQRTDAVNAVCRLCDLIIEIGVNNQQIKKILPYIDLYRCMAKRRNSCRLAEELEHIRQVEDIVNGILAEQAQ